MKRLISISVLSVIMLMANVLCVSAETTETTSTPVLTMNISAPDGTTLDFFRPAATTVEFNGVTSKQVKLTSYTFSGGIYFEIGVDVPYSGTIQVFGTGWTLIYSQSLNSGTNLVSFFIPMTANVSKTITIGIN